MCQSFPICVVSRLEANGEKEKEMERQSGGGAVVHRNLVFECKGEG